jgi:hypothetical protein
LPPAHTEPQQGSPVLPQLTQVLAAPQIVTPGVQAPPVQQDRPRLPHGTQLVPEHRKPPEHAAPAQHGCPLPPQVPHVPFMHASPTALHAPPQQG